MKKLDTWLRNPENIPDLTPKARDYILLLTELIHSSSFWVGRLNLVLFYMYGKYYRLSQRMAKIHYVKTTLDYKYPSKLIQYSISRYSLQTT
jgi:hypothetical protein